jgi:hypothetical protein
MPFLDRFANPEREISGDNFGIAANLFPFPSASLPLSACTKPSCGMALRFYFFAFPAAAFLTPAALATTDTAAARSHTIAAIATLRRRSSSFPPFPFVSLAPASRVPVRHFGGYFALYCT